VSTFTSFGSILEASLGKLNLTKFNDTIDREALLAGEGSTHISKFNRFDLPESSLFMNGLRGYIFFTRPDLNIIANNGVLNRAFENDAGYRELYKNGTYIDKMLISSLQQDTDFNSPYLPVLTNQVKGYNPEDQTLDSVEKGDTHHGSKLKYGKHSIHSRTAGSFSLAIEETTYLSVYKLISIWTDYIEKIFLGDTDPKDIYIKNAILDYAVSMFYVATKLDIAEIVYWEKLAGVFPNSRPDSAFATTKGQITPPEYSLQFQYSLKSKSSVLDPHVLSEINTLSRTTKGKIAGAYRTYDLKNNSIGQIYVNAPMIERLNNKFYLRWS